jgi:hypothetical protein
MKNRAHVTTTAALLAMGVMATSGLAAEGKFNTPMSGKTQATGLIGTNYDAGKLKLRNLGVDWGCAETDGGKPVYTSVSKFGKVYATVSRRTGKFKATIATNYGEGKDGEFDTSLGKATIKINGKMTSRPGKVNGTGTVTVTTARCSSGKLKFSWKGTNGS